MNKERKHNETIEVSTVKKNYNGAQNSHFELKQFTIKDLPQVVKQYNYSLIHWKDGSRKSSRFEKAVGFVGDYDEGATVQDVHDDLKARGLNHLIVTSKSHTAELHKFHVLIPFNLPVLSSKTYEAIAKEISERLLPGSDTSVTDAARFIYGSPNDADPIGYWDGEDYGVSSFGPLWNRELEIEDAKGERKIVSEFDGKAAIYCPFHEDSNPSAFIEFSEKSQNWFIHCSSCGETFWMEKELSYLDVACENYYSYGTDIWDFGMVNDEFFYEKIGEKKFHVLTKTRQNPDREQAYNHLVNNHHIRHISRLDYISDVAAQESFYCVDLEDGVITAHHAAIQVDVQDNAFIEDYLANRFGVHKDFIKEWMAMYCYSNFKKLPTLILKGGRGTGKSTFAEILADIFPTLSFLWGGNEEGFTYEAEKKLLIVEENLSDKVSQYKTLKKYSGQKHAMVKKKFKDPYMVKNNTSIIMLSNDEIPLYVNHSELPTDSRNNQFFVYEFPKLTGAIDPQLQEKLLARLGNYIRTELKIVWDGLNPAGYRYSIDVPITAEEKELFAANVSDLEADVDNLVDRLISDFNESERNSDHEHIKFVRQGDLPKSWVRAYCFGASHFNKMIKGMRRKGLLHGEPHKPTIDGRRIPCYQMSQSLIDVINEPTLEDKDLEVSEESGSVQEEIF